MTIKKIKAESITRISPDEASQVNGGTGTESWWGDCTSCVGTCGRYCETYTKTANPNCVPQKN